jgi:protein-ribulosamine 3-kinase
MQSSIQRYLQQYFSPRNVTIQFQSIGGGSINDCFRVTVNSDKFFLKINSVKKYPGLFQKEKNGLELLAGQDIIRVPKSIAHDEVDEKQILLLEWIEPGKRTSQFWKTFGEQLVWLHHTTQNYFGLDEDNYMGSLSQENKPHLDWNDFFINCRLRPQIKRAEQKQLLRSHHLAAFENLYPRFPEIFNEEKPSLLHGDLWNGNFMCDENSQPVLIDPAVYYGHRSIDLAMTTLFGGFDKEFYDAYHYHHPFPENYREQWEVANLYPLLIHLNLFGSGYLSQITSILKHFD